MCGVAGFFHPAGRAEADWRKLLETMAATLVHRGPDDQGIFLDAQVGLAHRRLSIVDLGGGHQPMSNEDETVWVVFNGEIYNFVELRAQLEAKGHVFRTRSDTETIVHAYEQWGAESVTHLDGMFAFAIWDARRRRLLLARDRFGKKPLYYARIGEALVFASEIKALLPFPGFDRRIDLEALSDYLSLLYVPLEKSIYRSVRKLLPGHYLVAERDDWKVERYWDLELTADAAPRAGAESTVAELLAQAVGARLHSDVPLGAFLSGGIDSAAVVGLMARTGARPVTTASVGFDHQDFDELEYARLAARRFGTNHHEYRVTPDALQVLEDLVWHFDEPFGDSSAVPTYYVAKLARERVTVALSGDGGDESFGGYRRYAFDIWENRVRALLPAGLRQPVFGLLGRLYPKADYLPQVLRGKAFLSNLARTPADAYLHSVSGIAELDKLRLLAPEVIAALGNYRTADLFSDLYRRAPGKDALARIQYVDFKTYLPGDILTKVDRASMASSLEVRCPLLDRRLVEHVARLPSRLKIDGQSSKVILKQAVRGLVPDEIIARPKMGFAMPVAHWLRHELQPWIEEHVLRARHDLFDPQTVAGMWRQHRLGIRDRTCELWGVLIFNLWYERFQ